MELEVGGGQTRLTVVKRLCTALLLAAACTLSAQAAPTPAPAAATKPVRPYVLELFTAQGCASCRDADGLVQRLKDRPDVIVLSYSVDYWDYVGWADTTAKPEFTARQRDYVSRLNLKDLSTPAVIVDGRRELGGVGQADVDALLNGPRRRVFPAPPSLKLVKAGAQAEIGAAGPPAGGADLWLIRYDPARREIKVRTGDNKDRTMVQTNAVRELVKIGTWVGRARRFDLPPAKQPGLRTVLLLQGVRDDRGVLAAVDDR